jgi:hypothetical protein
MELSNDGSYDRGSRGEVDPIFEIDEAPLQTPRTRDIPLLDLLC